MTPPGEGATVPVPSCRGSSQSGRKPRAPQAFFSPPCQRWGPCSPHLRSAGTSSAEWRGTIHWRASVRSDLRHSPSSWVRSPRTACERDRARSAACSPGDRRARCRARLRRLRGGRDLGRPGAAEHHRDAKVGVPRRGVRARDRAALERPHRRRGRAAAPRSDQGGHPTWQPGQPLYGASLGPNGSGEIQHTVNLSLPAGDFDDLGARAWVGDEPRPVTRAATQQAASGYTSPGRRSVPSSRSCGRPSSGCRAYWSGSRLATCLSARLAR